MREGEYMTNKKTRYSYEIGELDHYLFGQGTHYEIYKKMGAHKVKRGAKEGVYFSVWAPHAKAVSVVGEFNDWDKEKNPMERGEPLGIYTCFIPEAKEGMLYKFCIETYKGEFLYKADPFANYAEVRPGTASRITDITNLKWTDKDWLEKRKTWNHKESPVSIYEVHMGSWKRHEGYEKDNGFLTYREFAKEAVVYMKEMGYTHIELMGIAEYPFDASWGYQVTGYYAPTSRYGTPEDFAYMINYFHKNKIGVILDWVPAHFPRDAHGLADFDGTPTFEYADSRKGEHPDWGTKIFDYGKSEVQNFLIANALFWIEHFHVDGLRVDAVASMLYLDYGKEDGQWVANKYGGNENLEAIEFFKHLNSVVLGRNPGTLMIAEESTAWPKVTGDPEEDGLGFSLKWNMGWMHDFTEYMKLDPYFRRPNHHLMTFAMTYAYSENYILVLSHDEVVHLKCSMLNKMPGLGFDKFANLKVGYAFMMGHPGKKLLFMGQDFAQLREWSEERELDWYLLREDNHQAIQNFTRDLLQLYRKNKAMYECDNNPEGFEWVNANDGNRSIYSFIRHSKNGKKNLLFVCNFTPMEWTDYRVGVTRRKQYKLVIDSDEKQYGGSGKKRPTVYKATKGECDGKPYSFAYPLSPYGVAVFEF
ncbi:MAG: 1,4-alpha-glucan branching protein GlgB [Lachnospiraceae bacterium]|nr:1,4-alpha-glucan branching protein GlgB [Lachnospiraceae bacterium]